MNFGRVLRVLAIGMLQFACGSSSDSSGGSGTFVADGGHDGGTSPADAGIDGGLPALDAGNPGGCGNVSCGMTATINGAPWSSADCEASLINFGIGGTYIDMSCVDSRSATGIGIVAPATANTTASLSPGNITNANYIGTGIGYATFTAGSTGSVTTSTFTAHSASGTFNFQIPTPNQGESGGVLTVASGTFNVTF